jgi:hypothetical protein
MQKKAYEIQYVKMINFTDTIRKLLYEHLFVLYELSHSVPLDVAKKSTIR